MAAGVAITLTLAGTTTVPGGISVDPVWVVALQCAGVHL